ncbi:restriction endonuclease subunit S [Mycoplasmopsis fermentans]|uniref:restriction endonuclease subunit S n=1 Tax=Mycoplasmopsis fermentans TaxID=2115 RepID=UPI0001E33061|nr:restriction endonuclease subunit S [Mycoplasmopsis fermentans]ADN68852.1 type I site-specific deoxyribonuclease [Mycoplasmopsis fermentans JER]
MSYLQKLLDKYCPNGYEWVKLENIATFINGLKCKTKKDFLDGNEHYVSYLNVFNNQEIDFLPTSKVKISNNENQNCLQIGDVIFSGSSENFEETGYASVFNLISENKIYLNSFCFAIRFNNKNLFLPKFSKYLFNSEIFRNQLVKCINGVTRFNLSKVKFASIKVPLIPLKIQEKIVEILERFRILEAELKAELKAELEARGKQFNFWLKKIYGNIDSKYITKLENLDINIETGKLNANKKNENGKYLFFTCDEKPYRINEYAFDAESILISGNGSKLGHISYYEGKFNAYQRTYVLTSKDVNINLKYLYYFLKHNFKDYISSIHFGSSSVPYITLPILQEYKLKLPPLEIQNKIVSILDKLSEYSQEINSGLPAEIELRSKQFKYYRDQLLDFK